MVDRLLNLALIGGEPILYLLIFLSLLSIAVVIERYVYFFRHTTSVSDLSSVIVGKLNSGDLDEAIEIVQSSRTVEAAVVKEGLQNFGKGPEVVEGLMDSMTLQQSQNMDRWLIILGTIGSNAPFIGLLGTVLGIIKAFHDLAFDSQGGPSVVMAGIAEALVATAVGLLVAIPAVIFFNYFKNRQKAALSNISQIQRIIIAFMKSGRDSESGDIEQH